MSQDRLQPKSIDAATILGQPSWSDLLSFQVKLLWMGIMRLGMKVYKRTIEAQDYILSCVYMHLLCACACAVLAYVVAWRRGTSPPTRYARGIMLFVQAAVFRQGA